ncbi:MAG: hypothetical protein DMG89_25565 [Acidobacteria bacterium]|nr:MAG: hypothetical protein DMG89_25565 [Acidobacteriota bacterium]
MAKSLSFLGSAKIVAFLGLTISAHLAASQAEGTPLLRLQHSTAELAIDSAAPHAQGISGITTRNPGDVWRYPNSVSCLLVYGDGRYVYEKRDEPILGKPRVKLAEGSFTAEELQQMKAILDDGALRTMQSPPAPTLPDGVRAVSEIETLNAQIDRGGSLQEFMTVKERLKTSGVAGMETSLDNGTQSKKTLAPLLKWFKEVEKKNKSGLKDAKPQYCQVMNIG